VAPSLLDIDFYIYVPRLAVVPGVAQAFYCQTFIPCPELKTAIAKLILEIQIKNG
jgi:hypothetical protein